MIIYTQMPRTLSANHIEKALWVSQSHPVSLVKHLATCSPNVSFASLFLGWVFTWKRPKVYHANDDRTGATKKLDKVIHRCGMTEYNPSFLCVHEVWITSRLLLVINIPGRSTTLTWPNYKFHQSETQKVRSTYKPHDPHVLNINKTTLHALQKLSEISLFDNRLFTRPP